MSASGVTESARRRRKKFLKKLMKNSENGILPLDFNFNHPADRDCLNLINPEQIFFEYYFESKLGEKQGYVPPISCTSAVFLSNPYDICRICQNWGHSEFHCPMSNCDSTIAQDEQEATMFEELASIFYLD